MDWGKHTLWQRTSGVPFIWAGPGIKSGAAAETTVSLIDMYPTFAELCDLPAPTDLEGTSLAQVLRNPATAKDRNVLLPGMYPHEYAIINQNWRYIHYKDGTEELYDVKRDFNEWYNLADNSKYAQIKEKLKSSSPKSFAKSGPERNKLRLKVKGESFHWEPKNT